MLFKAVPGTPGRIYPEDLYGRFGSDGGIRTPAAPDLLTAFTYARGNHWACKDATEGKYYTKSNKKHILFLSRGDILIVCYDKKMHFPVKTEQEHADFYQIHGIRFR